MARAAPAGLDWVRVCGRQFDRPSRAGRDCHNLQVNLNPPPGPPASPRRRSAAESESEPEYQARLDGLEVLGGGPGPCRGSGAP
jgi:hypothetical protein